jgi:site-specific DNA-methyltransferase (adenine-specific)
MWEKTGEAKSDLEHDEWLDWTNGLWSFNGETNAWEGHPAPFPVELPRRSIKLLSYPGETVLDPFVGSGTTALAASTLGRKVYGYDHSAHYIESARRRLAQSTGVPIENASAA